MRRMTPVGAGDGNTYVVDSLPVIKRRCEAEAGPLWTFAREVALGAYRQSELRAKAIEAMKKEKGGKA